MAEAIGPAGLALQFASTLLGGLAQGEESARKQIEANENKQMALDAAADAIARGRVEGGRARTAGSKLISRQKVAYAAAGVDPTVGTPLDVMADTRVMSDLDAMTIENNAAREAWGFRKYGSKYGQQAALEATRQGYRSAGTILGGAGRMLSTYSGQRED